MEKIKIKDIDEYIYYEKLDNGLKVYLYTKDNVYSNYVTFTTKYGSIYNEFVPINGDKMIKVPKGVAHFLEHKVFEQKEDPQPMEFFAKSGSICNAYTTFKNTTYLFYATEALTENINYLLDYVQNIYLTPESVDSEKGIISEEIHMYEDRPNDILNEKIRWNTLHNNPFKDSIIGEIKDIERINKEDLETCYYTFYHPSNMFLTVCGNFDPEEVMASIKENQNSKSFAKPKEIKIEKYNESDKVVKDSEVINVSTSIPKVAYTLKIPLHDIKLSRRKLHLYMYILFTSLFDETSVFDKELKDNNIISNTTFISLLNCDTHLLISLINETTKYKEFLDSVKDRLKKLKVEEKDFNRKKKILISNEILAFENVEAIGDIIIDNIIFDGKLEDNPIEVINELNIDELNNLIKKLSIDNTSEVILKEN